MNRTEKTFKSNDEQEFSMNLEEDYNQEEFMKQSNLNAKVQKLSIMNDFNELCQKLNYQSEHQIEKKQLTDNTLAQYYVKCKEKNETKILARSTEIDGHKTNNQLISIPNAGKLSLLLTNNRSASQNQNALNRDKNNCSADNFGQNFQQLDLRNFKKNYSSVQDKKKILQPTKTHTNQYVFQNRLGGNDYQLQKNFVSNKVHSKNFIKKQYKNDSRQLTTSFKKQQIKGTQVNQKDSKQNNLKQSNLRKSIKIRHQAQSQKESKIVEPFQRPRIILYKKTIDLTQSTQMLTEALKAQLRRFDYDLPNQSQSTIEEGLFAKAIGDQKAKTGQTVLSPNCQQTHKEVPKMSAMQPLIPQMNMNIQLSPNPSGLPKPQLQRREILRQFR